MMQQNFVNKVIGQPWNEAIKNIVDFNPRGAYDHVQLAYNHPLKEWGKGFEKTDRSKRMIADFLIQQALLSQNTAAFIKNLLQSIPDPTK